MAITLAPIADASHGMTRGDKGWMTRRRRHEHGDHTGRRRGHGQAWEGRWQRRGLDR